MMVAVTAVSGSIASPWGARYYPGAEPDTIEARPERHTIILALPTMFPPAIETCWAVLGPAADNAYVLSACSWSVGLWEAAGPDACSWILGLAAGLLVMAVLRWLCRPAPKPFPPPKRVGPADPVIAALAALINDVNALQQELRAPRHEIAWLITRAQEGDDEYYCAVGGRKLHYSKDCHSLKKAKEVEQFLAPDHVVPFLYKSGAMCVRCSGPHPPAKDVSSDDESSDDKGE